MIHQSKVVQLLIFFFVYVFYSFTQINLNGVLKKENFTDCKMYAMQMFKKRQTIFHIHCMGINIYRIVNNSSVVQVHVYGEVWDKCHFLYHTGIDRGNYNTLKCAIKS